MKEERNEGISILVYGERAKGSIQKMFSNLIFGSIWDHNTKSSVEWEGLRNKDHVTIKLD